MLRTSKLFLLIRLENVLENILLKGLILAMKKKLL